MKVDGGWWNTRRRGINIKAADPGCQCHKFEATNELMRTNIRAFLNEESQRREAKDFILAYEISSIVI